MALTSLGSPGEVVPLNSSHRKALYFCVKISLGHIYSFQYLLSKVIFLGAWKACHNIENEARCQCKARVWSSLGVWGEVGRDPR